MCYQLGWNILGSVAFFTVKCLFGHLSLYPDFTLSPVPQVAEDGGAWGKPAQSSVGTHKHTQLGGEKVGVPPTSVLGREPQAHAVRENSLFLLRGLRSPCCVPGVLLA